ncbi:hypothetical protein JCM5350_001919 [Sporobolomyces pararoseus]
MDTFNTDTEPEGALDYNDRNRQLFATWTLDLRASVRRRDPREGIKVLETSIYHGLQGIGLLAYKWKWLVIWNLLLAYGLWRIEEMEEVAERLSDIKIILEDYEKEIGAETAAKLLARAQNLSRYPDVPHVDGITPDKHVCDHDEGQMDTDTQEGQDASTELQARRTENDEAEVLPSLSDVGEVAHELETLHLDAAAVNTRIRKEAEDSPTFSTPLSLSPASS